MKLYDEVRHKLRLLHSAIDTEDCYLRWIDQFVRFHKKGDVGKHPNSMREAEIEEFLSYLAVDRQVAASTQNQAFAAILFLYEKVLEIKLERIDALRAQRKKRIPEVLSLAEVRELLNQIDRYPTREPFAFMLRLMYGTGMQTFRVAKYRAK